MSVFQEREGLASAVEGTGLVAEAEVMLVGGHVLVDGEAPSWKVVARPTASAEIMLP